MAKQDDFTGVWRSAYRFTSSDRDGEYENVHYVTMHRNGSQLVVESLSDTDDAYMLARFSLDGRVATGSWQDQMAQHGFYKGTMYHGAAQLIIDEGGNALRGKWVGFGKNLEIKTGDWEITRVEGEVPEKHAFAHKVEDKS
jgi:hypothetical protein